MDSKVLVNNPRLQSNIKQLRLEVYGEISHKTDAYELKFYQAEHEEVGPLMQVDGGYHVFYTFGTNRMVLFKEV